MARAISLDDDRGRKASGVGASPGRRVTLLAMTIRGWAGVSGLALAAAITAGCAASPARSGAQPPTEPGPATIEQAQAELARARTELGLPPSDTTTPAPQLELRKSEEKTTDLDATRREAGPDGECGNACKAMASMRRAVEAICRMAGESDPRCTDARKTLTDSASRVGACGC